MLHTARCEHAQTVPRRACSACGSQESALSSQRWLATQLELSRRWELSLGPSTSYLNCTSGERAPRHRARRDEDGYAAAGIYLRSPPPPFHISVGRNGGGKRAAPPKSSLIVWTRLVRHPSLLVARPPGLAHSRACCWAPAPTAHTQTLVSAAPTSMAGLVCSQEMLPTRVGSSCASVTSKLASPYALGAACDGMWPCTCRSGC